MTHEKETIQDSLVLYLEEKNVIRDFSETFAQLYKDDKKQEALNLYKTFFESQTDKIDKKLQELKSVSLDEDNALENIKTLTDQLGSLQSTLSRASSITFDKINNVQPPVDNRTVEEKMINSQQRQKLREASNCR